MLSRRSFSIGLTSAAFSGLALSGCATIASRAGTGAAEGYGELVPDPARLLDLPRGFHYQIISRVGVAMSDGYPVPDRADGMGAFQLDERRMALVRNHELALRHLSGGPVPAGVHSAAAFDKTGDRVLPGGTTTIVYDYRAGRVEREYLSLTGTLRNCAGGVTPWGSWLTCEEDVTRAGEGGVSRDHGWVFEVPAQAGGPVAAVPLKALGRFNHEAVAVDPRTGIVYLTEDRDDSLFYRFLPSRRGVLSEGGRLQALAFKDSVLVPDSRNWGQVSFPRQSWRAAKWVDLDQVDSPNDDLRKRGHSRGAVLFARGEGIHFGDGELFFCCTSGGAAKLSQIMRYRPSQFEAQAGEDLHPGRLQLFVESTDASMLNFGDNLTVAPTGHLIVCEDQYTDPMLNHLQGVTPEGAVYKFARLHEQTELAGACFSPDGKTMFVNIYSPAKTVAIRGPWSNYKR